MADKILKFNPNGKFRIMQIADTQEIPAVSPDTIALIEAALDSEKPDLVVFTGDQIEGYSPYFAVKNAPDFVRDTIYKLIAPIEERNIPFVVTFGNHDEICKTFGKQEQMDYYMSFPGCRNTKPHDRNDRGTFCVPIMSSDGKRTAFAVYVIDSGGSKKTGGYNAVKADQITWYRQKRDEMREREGDYVPALTFQHIPVPEFYNVLRQAGFLEKHSVEAYRIHKNKYYKLDKDKVRDGGFMLESPAAPDVNTGEFDAMREKHDVLGIFVGHDHNNSFVASYRGMDLGYTQGAGFNVYGPGKKRGIRVFELDERSPREYQTYTRTFEELCGGRVHDSLKEFIMTHIPTSRETIKTWAPRMIIPAAVAGTAVYFTVKAIKKK